MKFWSANSDAEYAPELSASVPCTCTTEAVFKLTMLVKDVIQ